jgi:phosphoribosylaminoimidazole carboxylase
LAPSSSSYSDCDTKKEQIISRKVTCTIIERLLILEHGKKKDRFAWYALESSFPVFAINSLNVVYPYLIFLGGGQLGRMLAYPASLLNLDLTVLDPLPNAPAKQILNKSLPSVSPHIDGSFTDEQSILQLATNVDVLTVEIEHVNANALEKVQSMSKGGQKGALIEIHPAPSTLRTIQDKLIQKQWFERHGIAIAPFVEIEHTGASVSGAGSKLGYPFMLKSRTLAYDGRGNYVVQGPNDGAKALAALGAGPDVDEVKKRKLYAEKWVPFEREVAVMVVKGKNGEIRSYPPVETIHRDSICHLVYAPLRAADTAVSLSLPNAHLGLILNNETHLFRSCDGP